MRKAFDVINFDILLEKLKIYGCHVSSLKCFESYIKGRKQFIINNNSTSDMNITTYGILEGSILGPLLFLIYINDFSLYIPDTNVNMYADDTTIYFNDKVVNSIESRLKSQLEKLCTW